MAAAAKKAHRATSFNNDHGGIEKGRRAAQKYWKRDMPLRRQGSTSASC